MIIMASKGHFCVSKGTVCTHWHRMCGNMVHPPHPPQVRPQRPTLTQIPQPMHNSSEIHAILELGTTSTQSLPVECVHCVVHNHHVPTAVLPQPQQRTNLDNRAALFAFLPALFRLAPDGMMSNDANLLLLQPASHLPYNHSHNKPVCIYNGNTCEGFLASLVFFLGRHACRLLGRVALYTWL